MAKKSIHAKHELLVAFGEAIRDRRKELGISQEELAARAGVDRSYVGGVERGENNPTLLVAERLLSGVGLYSLSSFFDEFRKKVSGTVAEKHP